ncbi:MAG: HIRAN domain-containing protein [Bryobacteraceae bacterium]
MIGRLSSDGTWFTFGYTHGAIAAQGVGFRLLASFPNVHEMYHSKAIFPLFSNRLLRPTRPEYRDYLSWLDIDDDDPQPLEILGRSGGERATDNMEIVPLPERSPEGDYETRFFLRGLQRMASPAIDRAKSLQAGEPLLLMHDFQNPHDNRALALRTSEETTFMIGYCPRLLRDDVLTLIDKGSTGPIITVARVNLPPAPSQFRVLCKVQTPWPEGFVPCSGEQFQPIAAPDREPQLA